MSCQTTAWTANHILALIDVHLSSMSTFTIISTFHVSRDQSLESGIDFFCFVCYMALDYLKLKSTIIISFSSIVIISCLIHHRSLLKNLRCLYVWNIVCNLQHFFFVVNPCLPLLCWALSSGTQWYNIQGFSNCQKHCAHTFHKASTLILHILIRWESEFRKVQKLLNMFPLSVVKSEHIWLDYDRQS